MGGGGVVVGAVVVGAVVVLDEGVFAVFRAGKLMLWFARCSVVGRLCR